MSRFTSWMLRRASCELVAVGLHTLRERTRSHSCSNSWKRVSTLRRRLEVAALICGMKIWRSCCSSVALLGLLHVLGGHGHAYAGGYPAYDRNDAEGTHDAHRHQAGAAHGRHYALVHGQFGDGAWVDTDAEYCGAL